MIQNINFIIFTTFHNEILSAHWLLLTLIPINIRLYKDLLHWLSMEHQLSINKIIIVIDCYWLVIYLYWLMWLLIFRVKNAILKWIWAQLKILIGKPIFTQELTHVIIKLKENIINVSLPACNIFRMRNRIVKRIYIDWHLSMSE